MLPARFDAVELGTGNFSSAPHCDLGALLGSAAERRSLLDALAARNLTLSALNCSGNILDGDAGRRARSQRIFFDTLKLANLLGVHTVVAMSGCPGESTAAGTVSQLGDQHLAAGVPGAA